MRSLALVVTAIGVLAAGPATAQEWTTYANRLDRYNMTEYTILKGVVREVHWINPHTWIYIEVKDDKGEPTMWALEGASVVQVERRGWKKDMIKVGSTIGVRCHQLRDKSSGCLLGFITLEGTAEKMFD
jgi:hypothetical protein